MICNGIPIRTFRIFLKRYHSVSEGHLLYRSVYLGLIVVANRNPVREKKSAQANQ